MMENIDKIGTPKEGEIQWVTLSQNSKGDWTPSGPFKAYEVRHKMEAGLLKPTDYCWQTGWADWKRIYDEPSFYHSRKPPIEIPTVKKENAIEFKEVETLSARSEMAERIQVGVNKKKSSSNMLEPWENAQRQAGENNEDPATLLNSDIPAELSSESLKTMQSDREAVVETKKPLWKNKFVIAIAMVALTAALVLDVVYEGLIYQAFAPVPTELSVSYIMVEDYNPTSPKHLMARTDLKKGQKLTIRVLDSNEKPLKTLKGGDGLKIPSKGTGKIRIPLYPYDLAEGSYKILVRAGEAEVLKTFTIPAGVQLSNAVKTDSSKASKDK